MRVFGGGIRTGTESFSGSLTGGATVEIVMQGGNLFPQLYSDVFVGLGVLSCTNNNDADPDKPQFAIKNDSGVSKNYEVNSRYIEL